MAASVDDIRSWLLIAKGYGASHVIVVADTLDWEDYPVYVMPDEDIHEKVENYYGVNAQNVMEVYNLAMDIEEQLSIPRAWNY